MDDLSLGIDEELELDYEAEEAANKASKIEKSNSPPSIVKVLSEALEDDVPQTPEAEQEAKKLSRKRRCSPTRWNKGTLNEFGDDIEPGRDLSAPKKFRFLPHLLPKNFFPDECDGEEPPTNVVDDHPELTRSEVAKLFESLDVENMDDESVPLNSVYIRGTKQMTNFAIEKIFAEFDPHIALKVDDESFIVQFKTSRIAAKMLVAMSKKVKRVRKPQQFEDGEIPEDGEMHEEEVAGQVKQDEQGEKVELVNEIQDPKDDVEEVPIDVSNTKIPKGRWRVLTKHVNYGKILLVKYAHYREIVKAKNNTENVLYRQQRAEAQQTGVRCKPGINVFDSTGVELPWNFNHDTRIFNDPSLKNIEDDLPLQEPGEKVIRVGDQLIKSKGRGRCSFKPHFSSDEEDGEEESEQEDEPMPTTGWLSKKVKPPTKPSDTFRDSILK